MFCLFYNGKQDNCTKNIGGCLAEKREREIELFGLNR